MDIIIRSNVKRSEVYDQYWKFAAERMSVYYKRIRGHEGPWTDDEIIRKYKFTNTYRVIDRVSQYLIREIINVDERNHIPPEDRLFRILLFKIFNKIETWETLNNIIPEITWSAYKFDDYDKVLSSEMASNKRIYSAAYIMASGGKYFGSRKKHRNHLKLLEHMMNDKLLERISICRGMGDLYELLKSYPTIGSFLAYQYATDINYSTLVDYSEMEFVKAGPGASDGIRKCFTSIDGYTEEDVIRFMSDHQDIEFERLGISFPGLFGRKLMMIDCQNIFCEIGKYARVAYPNISGTTKRNKIKQLYKSTQKLTYPSFPKKWNLPNSQGIDKWLNTLG